MEDKKKNKIFIVSSCVIASLVIALVIALVPQMQLKANRNVYQDEMAHGASYCLEYEQIEHTTTDTETSSASTGSCSVTPVVGPGCDPGSCSGDGDWTISCDKVVTYYTNGECIRWRDDEPSVTATPTATISSTCVSQCVREQGLSNSECERQCGGGSSTPTPTPKPTATISSTCVSQCVREQGLSNSECEIQCGGGSSTPTPTPKPTATPQPEGISCCRLVDGVYKWSSDPNNPGTAGCASLIIGDCGENGILNKNKKDCEELAKHGDYSWDETEKKCIESRCPAGYSAENGDCCITVGAGAYLDVAGGSNVMSCPVGTYATGSNSSRKYCLNDSSSTDNSASLSCTKCPSGKTSPIGSTSADDCVEPTGDCKLEIVTSAKTVSPAGNDHYADNFTVTVRAVGDGCNGKKLDLSALGAACGSSVNNKDGGIVNGTISNGQTFNIVCKATDPCSEATVTASFVGSGGTTSATNNVSVKTSSAWHKVADNECLSLSDYNSHYHSDHEADDNLDKNGAVKDNPNMHYIVDGTYNPGNGKCAKDTEVEADIWVRSCGGSYYSPPSTTTTTVVNPTYACYADSDDLKSAKRVEWRTGKTDILKYKITHGADGKTEINSSNYATLCKAPDNLYCYANAENLYDATQAELLSGPTGKLQFQIKDSNGSPVTNANSCIASACYLENNTTNYMWALNGSLDSSKYTKVAIYNRDDCKCVESCMAKPGKDDYIDVEWVKSQSSINARLKEGWIVIAGVESSDLCKPGACYQNNADKNEYVWLSVGQDKTGYTKVDSSKCDAPTPEAYTQPACYVKTLKDGTVEYKWGEYSHSLEYSKIKIPEEYCISSKNCYLYTKDGTYHDGDYSLNPDYIMVDDANCKRVPVPKTAFDKSKVMYISMLFLAVAGVGLTYYGNLKRKHG